ncbi:hypothetical protein F5146DRAFT_1065461 [Armillaria mellea]|nr:hypothetical protein F5146DRAFT_1065461 [Armillaria mellea]
MTTLTDSQRPLSILSSPLFLLSALSPSPTTSSHVLPHDEKTRLFSAQEHQSSRSLSSSTTTSTSSLPVCDSRHI